MAARWEAILPADVASCHLRAMRGGLWRLLAVIHGPSGHFDALACAALLPDRWSPPPPRPVGRAHDSVLVPPW
jgi:hypothetical protein